MNKQISTQTRLGLRNPGSSFSKMERTQSSKIDNSIIEAFNKFSSLSNQYQVQFESCHLFSTDGQSKFLSKRKGKVDNFTIMAQLRHLENMASLTNAQHEKVERQNRRHKMSHNFYRKRRNWKKLENNLNTPYLTLYNNWAKQKQQEQEIFLQNSRDQEQSQQEKSINQEELCDKIFAYTKQLKPYKKIVQYTKSKLKIKQEFKKNSSPKAKRKAQSLDELESAPKNKKFYPEYNQISRKYAEKKERQKIKTEGVVPTEKIIQKNISRIFKKSNNNGKVEELMNHERFSNLLRKQSEIIENSLNRKHDSYKQVKGKFAQIIIEMSKSVVVKKPERQISDSVDLRKKTLQINSKPSKYSIE